MKRYLLAAMAVVGSVTTAQAGGPPPMYVVVDKIVIEPSDTTAERIKIEGSFVRLVENNRKYEYGKPVAGYVYLGLDANKAKETRAEWEKWQMAAGTGKAVAVGSCQEAGSFLTVKIRKLDEKAERPDATYTPGKLELFGSLYASGDLARESPVTDLLAFAKSRAQTKPANSPR